MRLRILLCCLLCAVSFLSCHEGNDTAVVDVNDTVVIAADTIPRASITFIMGEDNWAYNQYYTLANHYYRMSQEDRTDIVVEGLSSLSQVLDYLQNHPPANGRPYGLVNIVSHGNEFVDLQMRVVPGGERTSVGTLFRAWIENGLTAPDSTVVDSLTTIFLHGCAVGQNRLLLTLLARVFGEGHGATVKASKLFEYYAYLARNRNPQSVQHYYARTWYAFYHPDSAIDEKAMLRQLRRLYPHDTTHWHEGLRRRFQENPSQLYHYSFEVPCVYEEAYAEGDNPPSVYGQHQRERWLSGHSDFAELIATTHIPQRYFQIKFYRCTYLHGDRLVYGLKVKARAGVVCLIQPLTQSDSTGIPFVPYRPEEHDTSIFTIAAYRQPTIVGPCQCLAVRPAAIETFLCQKKDVPL